MFIEYKPRDPAVSGDPQSWEFDPEDMLGSHAEMVERRFGGTWEQWHIGVISGGMKARRILLWYLRMREHPGYQLDTMPDFRTGELRVSFSSEELQKMRAAVVKAPNDDPEERERMLYALDVQISEVISEEHARRGAVEVDEGEGKALSPSDGSATG